MKIYDFMYPLTVFVMHVLFPTLNCNFKKQQFNSVKYAQLFFSDTGITETYELQRFPPAVEP